MSIVVAQAKNSTEAPRALESRQHHERVLGGSRREGGDPAKATAANSLKLLKEQHVADVHGVPNKFLTAIERSYRGPTSGKCENRHMDLSRTKLFVTDTS